MEEYLKKQEAKRQGSAAPAPPAAASKPSKDASEDSAYSDDEFDSYSKSQSQVALPKMNAAMDKVMVPSSVKQAVPSKYLAPATRKDGKVTQTEEGKYSYMPAA